MTESPQGGPAVNAVVKWGRAATEALRKIKQASEGEKPATEPPHE